MWGNKRITGDEGACSSADTLAQGIESLSISSPKEVTLISSDNKSFKVETSIARQSLTIKNIIEDDCAEDGVPLPNVTGDVLAEVIEFCKKHVSIKSSSSSAAEDLRNWDAKFVKQFNESALFDLVLAAHYLDIKDLYELMCQAIADVAKTKSPAAILKMFNIGSDFKFDA